MTGFAVFVLTAAACLLLLPSRQPLPADTSGGVRPKAFGNGRRSKAAAAQLDQLPLFVRQLAALLRSGRAPAQLWPDMLAVYVSPGRPDEERQGSRKPGGPGLAAAVPTEHFQLLLPRLQAAAQAAELGMGIGPVLRRSPPASGRQSDTAAAAAQRMWLDLASCWEVSERTGAPLALLLENYARHLQDRLDGRAARRTALAGPRATATLLAWLPLLGLGLGTVMGADPVSTLLLSASGWPVLVVGVALMIGARLWSRALVRRAAGPDAL
ncbi:type II secretion system F family protein [Arthrobacter sulfonylureivorans]|uniref:type II secretion system F family protein n=1 Tax=Arthrobacter sulfonylureivorans TaxID=2486855 RepID=UPI0039E32DEA